MGSLRRRWCPHAVPLRSNVQGDSQTGICITIEPGLLLKGDILVRSPSPARPPGAPRVPGDPGSGGTRPDLCFSRSSSATTRSFAARPAT